jgi:hypothetical protein
MHSPTSLPRIEGRRHVAATPLPLAASLPRAVAVLLAGIGTAGLLRAAPPAPVPASMVGAAAVPELLPVVPYLADAIAPEPRRAPAGPWHVLTQDITLARTLERWGAEAGFRVKWDAQRNFLIGAPDSIEGTFETALQSVLGSAGIRQSDYPLEACIYANTPPLVRITRQGEQARECVAP